MLLSVILMSSLVPAKRVENRRRLDCIDFVLCRVLKLPSYLVAETLKRDDSSIHYKVS